MKKEFILLLLFISQVALGQDVFTFTESGLTPKDNTIKVEGMAEGQLYQKTLQWIQANFEDPAKVITDKKASEYITITDVKPNYLNVRKDYFYVRYSVKIRFEGGQYSLEPVEVSTKVNSKYDMGWQKLDLQDGTKFFKRGKAIKATKSYVDKIPSLFNELNASLAKAMK